ncbi:ABC transporter permease [Fundicoccus culcitae]|uniref:ABC-2 family transporter protein n=1 Tax=Fundicoccus culcitae TaxID=2969821 RepID=A0ABY5P5U9_9LACT|nr:ABC-2 family transporter protein [Fundicoccus culcitae]UUX34132.1 ABC-2 family transporter protein [Fundicoccus culcitae]
MKRGLAIFKIRFLSSIQFRTAALAGVVTQFAWGFLSILMYKAFYDTNPNAFPMSFSALTDYIWLQQALLNLFALWIYDNELFTSVANGQLAYELARPLDLYNYWFIRSLANRVARTLLRFAPTLMVAFIIPQPYGLSLPVNLGPFMLSLFLATLLVVSITMLVHISAIFTLSATGIRMFVVVVGEFLTGGVIPLPFFPTEWQTVIERSPFGLMQNIPFRIYSGDITDWSYLGLQLLWFVVLFLLGHSFMKIALKQIVIQGG